LDQAKREEAKRKADKYISREGGAPADVKGKLKGLSEMAPAEYSRRREAICEETGVSRSFLDMEWKARRKAAKAGDDVGTDGLSEEPSPWPDPVDGAELLNQLVATTEKYLILPPGGAAAMALWSVFTHVHDCFEISPVLTMTSPTPECGKTTAFILLGELVKQPLPSSNVTGAVVFRAVDKWHPTLLIDEADTFIKDKDELRGILNSGHNRRNAWVIRNHGDNHEPRRFSTWSPKAFALIGKLHPTLASRSILVRMQRKLPSEMVQRLRGDRAFGAILPLRRKIIRWAADHEAALRGSDPELPAVLQSRVADNWGPLVAIADQAGGEWPKKVRDIAQSFAAVEREDTAAIMALADLKAVFERRGVDKLHSDDIVADLNAMEDRPWSGWHHGKGLTKANLASLLKAFVVAPRQIKIGGTNKHGYVLTYALKLAFTRYLPATPLPFEKTQGFDGDIETLSQGLGSVSKSPANPQEPAKGSGVAPKSPLSQENEETVPYEERVDGMMKHCGLSRQEAEAEARRWQ
jgi:putative DNA primase/helicase